jgi:linoleoyl-CoA desaturase
MSDSKRVSFNKDQCDFTTLLKKRVSAYFASSNRSPKANRSMWVKSLFMMGLTALTFGAILTGVFGGWGTVVLYACMGFLVATGTMNIAHDALHGAYVTRSWGNRALGFSMDLFGASSFYWKKEHTVDHHTFTNIAEHDADLAAPFLLRLCPKAPRYSFHRFQHWYAPLLYSLNLIRWVYVSDFKRVIEIVKERKTSTSAFPKREIFLLFFFKALHVFIFLALPMIVLTFPWWQVLLGYIGLLSVTGITMTTIFQLAHIVENVAFPLPNDMGKIDNSFSKHQLATTSNFATKNRLVGFLFGGLNFQIEHHLFPHVCHTHLKALSVIVKETAGEFGLPYYENASFFGAIRSHFRTLKRFGRPCSDPS